MKYNCPNSQCPNDPKNPQIIKNGKFRRSSDSRYVQKFKCKSCGKQFSQASFTLEKYQKKRRINYQIIQGLSSGVSMRRLAKLLGVNPKTIERKLHYLAKKCEAANQKFLEKLTVKALQFDDLITIEHTKLKPLSISVAVDVKHRYLLGCEVSRIGAFGNLAQKSRNKYGKRNNEHKEGLKKLFNKLASCAIADVKISSDEHAFYPEIVTHYFPQAEYERFKSEKSFHTGQGELKKIWRDPLFSVNHVCAMLRANINRLVRRTWCTTKKPEMLQKHLEVFIYYFNQIYLKQVKT